MPLYKLLIVDDEASMLEGLSTAVHWEALGYSIAALLPDGLEAIEYLAAQPVDVVLTDIRMPGASGVDVARYIHERQLPVRVVLLSGYREFEDAQKAMLYGVRHYLTKPFLLSDLRDVMRGIAGELDAERAEETQRKRQEEETRRFMRESFFVEAALGALRSDFAFNRWVEILSIDREYLAARCALIDLDSEHTIPQLRAALMPALGDAFACMLRLPDGCVRMLCLEFDERQEPPAAERVLAAVLGARIQQATAYDDVRALSLAQQTVAREERILPPALPTAPGNDAAATACRYIQEHYAEKITLTEVAQYVYLNPAYLSRMFSEQTGYTFRDYLTNTRMQAAARMLTTTRLTVYNICEQVGYSNVKHFYRQFKQIMRVTPTEYRDMLRKDRAT